MALFIVREIIKGRVSSDEELVNIQGAQGVLVESRIGAENIIIGCICTSACVRQDCFSNNPGCKFEKLYPEIRAKYWNKLLGLMDD